VELSLGPLHPRSGKRPKEINPIPPPPEKKPVTLIPPPQTKPKFNKAIPTSPKLRNDFPQIPPKPQLNQLSNFLAVPQLL